MVEHGEELKLQVHLPPNQWHGKTIGNTPAIELGTEPILFMRHSMHNKSMHMDSVQKVQAGS